MLLKNDNSYNNNTMSTTDGIDSNTTVLGIVKLYYTAPSAPILVSYQKVLNKSQNFSSRLKFSPVDFACHEIKKKSLRTTFYIYYIKYLYTAISVRAENHTIEQLCDVYDCVKHKTRACRERSSCDLNLEVTKAWIVADQMVIIKI